MSGASVIICAACGKVCGCKKSSAPNAEACGTRAPATKLAWSMTGLPLEFAGHWTQNITFRGGSLEASLDHTGLAKTFATDATAAFSVSLENAEGEADAGPLVTTMPLFWGSAVFNPAACIQGVAGLYAMGTATQFANGPVVFDALTTTGLPYVLGTYAATHATTVDEFTNASGNTSTGPQTTNFDVDAGFIAYTALQWTRAGEATVRMRTQIIRPNSTDPPDVSGEAPWSFSHLGPTSPGGVGLPWNQSLSIQVMETLGAADGPADGCTLPAEGDVPAQADDVYAENIDDTIETPGESDPLYYTFDSTATEEEDYSFHHDPTAGATPPGYALRLARLDSATVDAVDELPDNPGCRDCDRAYRVQLTNPHPYRGPFFDVFDSVWEIDAIFVQRCLSPEQAAGAPSRFRPFPFGCQWLGEDASGIAMALTKVGPQLYRLDRISGGSPVDGATVWIKATGDCPSSIVDSMFFVSGPGPSGGTLPDAGRYTIEITPVDQPEDHACFCDAGCGDCAGEPDTLAADPCPDTLPAVPMIRTSAPEVCDFAGSLGGLPDDVETCDAAMLAIGNNDHIFYRVDAWTPAPQPEDWDEEYYGPWTWTPPSPAVIGTNYRLNYFTGPTRYGGDGLPDRQWWNDGIGCPNVSSGTDVLINFYDNASGTSYTVTVPWQEVLGTHTIDGTDGSKMTITFTSPFVPNFRSTVKVVRDDGGVRYFENRYGPGSTTFTGWQIVSRKKCEGGPRGEYDVVELVGEPPCEPETVEVG